jgi:hypothetical protein
VAPGVTAYPQHGQSPTCENFRASCNYERRLQPRAPTGRHFLQSRDVTMLALQFVQENMLMKIRPIMANSAQRLEARGLCSRIILCEISSSHG